MFEYSAAECSVECIVRIGKVSYVGNLKADIRHLSIFCKCGGLFDHAGFDIDANGLTGATASARPKVMVPGPQPQSKILIPDCKRRIKNSATGEALRPI